MRHFCFPQAPWIIEDKRPPADWPSRGELEFINYSVRYRKGLDLVLKDLNLRVHGGEKVGTQPWGSAVALGHNHGSILQAGRHRTTFCTFQVRLASNCRVGGTRVCK